MPLRRSLKGSNLVIFLTHKKLGAPGGNVLQFELLKEFVNFGGDEVIVFF
jgi:hypothetical protein